MTVPDLTGEIPVAHIARAPRADVVQVRRPVAPTPVSASSHVALAQPPRSHGRVFYIVRAVARAGMWLLFALATAAGIWASIWLAYAIWVTR